jgi:2-keto-4-pentenoate hydratase/2-oxohepta-3-ene-1,7-dioic acid hydratase in catechol pathway
MELVVAIGQPGFRVTEADTPGLIHGYACGLDMTRRDLQSSHGKRAARGISARTSRNRRWFRRSCRCRVSCSTAANS